MNGMKNEMDTRYAAWDQFVRTVGDLAIHRLLALRSECDGDQMDAVVHHEITQRYIRTKDSGATTLDYPAWSAAMRAEVSQADRKYANALATGVKTAERPPLED